MLAKEMEKKKSTSIGVFGRPRIDRGVPFVLATVFVSMRMDAGHILYWFECLMFHAGRF